MKFVVFVIGGDLLSHAKLLFLCKLVTLILNYFSKRLHKLHMFQKPQTLDRPLPISLQSVYTNNYRLLRNIENIISSVVQLSGLSGNHIYTNKNWIE